MAELIIACLSQKGGVGKSTIARLIATAYAAHDTRVAIYDFNGTQETSTFWSRQRKSNEIEPAVHAEVATQANRMRSDLRFDVIVADGRPDSPDITLSIAREADFIVVPTSVTMDDLVPQLRFARELVTRGVPKERILFVVNRVTENKLLIKDAYDFIGEEFAIASASLPYRDAFIRCHTAGFSVGEVKEAVMGNMNNLAQITQELATEIATHASGAE
ncbi:ParA family protein [Rhodobacteraceae bacterium R_SAG4]|nr:ParA family protein [Rhodobacteraceae bacterium R_SAG4]